MTQQNKGVVSKIFYNIRKNRVAYLEIKWKRQKDLQFGRLVVVVVVGSSSSSSSSSSSRSSSSSSKRRKRYTKYTEEKEAEDENWQKKCGNFLHLFGF